MLELFSSRGVVFCSYFSVDGLDIVQVGSLSLYTLATGPYIGKKTLSEIIYKYFLEIVISVVQTYLVSLCFVSPLVYFLTFDLVQSISLPTLVPCGKSDFATG